MEFATSCCSIEFREKVEARQVRAAALPGHSLACPFDLHALLSVPETILQRGPTHPAALTWLAAKWGIADRLRQEAMARPVGPAAATLLVSRGTRRRSLMAADNLPS